MGLAFVLITFAAFAALAASTVCFVKERTPSALSQLVGSGLFIVVVFAHVAEAYQVLPGMGWGLPNSPGHYVDLFAAVVGLGLFIGGYFSRKISKRSR